MDRREICRRYYLSHREKCYKSSLDWKRRNPERWREMRRRYRAKNAERIKAYAKIYRETHREEQRIRMNEWRFRNKDAIREYERVRMLDQKIRERRKEQRRTRELKRRAEARIASLGFNLFGGQLNMAEKEKVYINSPFKPSTAKRIKALAEKSSRSLGRQVAWMVERFMEER